MNNESKEKDSNFENVEYDITDFCLSMWCCCCLSSKKLIFEKEHVIILTNTPICTERRIIHYSDLDKVESNICFGCSQFNSSFGPIEPGFCGCNKRNLVEDIVREFSKRIDFYNNNSNLESKLNEVNLLYKISKDFDLLNIKVDKIINNLEKKKNIENGNSK